MNGKPISQRSISQRSIDNYPEHLNPFYEDENHKRLRFWKIGNDKSNRSFSIDGLKGLWSFKTFKLRKKSSTLGINKTSESPPMHRRDDDRYGSQTTFDGRMRHTVDIGLGSNFLRGPCRSSLQDLKSASSSFVRNNRYRSTVQAGNSNLSQQEQYQNNTGIGSITPVFRSRYSQGTISRGSSQLSVNSTNPFDDEYETISQIGSPERSSGSIRCSGRKKRRAPQPPLAPPPPSSVSPCDASVGKPDQDENITNLTAEIESFVRQSVDTNQEKVETSKQDNIGPDIEITENKNEVQQISTTFRQSPESNDYYPQDGHMEEITVEKIENLGTTDINSNERSKKSPVKIFIRAPISSLDEGSKSNFHSDIVIIAPSIENHEQCDPAIVNDGAENSVKYVDKNVILIENVEETTTPTSSPLSSAVEFILEHEKQTDNIEDSIDSDFPTVLKITESNDNLTKVKSDDNDTVQMIAKEECKIKEAVHKQNTAGSNRFEVQTIPLKFDSPKLRKKNFGKDNNHEIPTPPQRRRSVKEIIESINKCQSLLKINQEKTSISSSKALKNNSNEKQYQTNRAEVNNNDNIPSVVEKFNECNNNSNILLEKNIPNVEWNPVPKPRRHHKHTTQGSIY